jgi:hypothetical protein
MFLLERLVAQLGHDGAAAQRVFFHRDMVDRRVGVGDGGAGVLMETKEEETDDGDGDENIYQQAPVGYCPRRGHDCDRRVIEKRTTAVEAGRFRPCRSLPQLFNGVSDYALLCLSTHIRSAMAVISSGTIISSLSVFKLICAFFLVSNPQVITGHNLVVLVSGAVNLVRASV